jgi:hypothetical protein
MQKWRYKASAQFSDHPNALLVPERTRHLLKAQVFLEEGSRHALSVLLFLHGQKDLAALSWLADKDTHEGGTHVTAIQVRKLYVSALLGQAGKPHDRAPDD